MENNNDGWVKDLNYPKELISDFYSKLDISGKPSIDSFLKRQKEEFWEIGKLSIVDKISQYESNIQLFDRRGLTDNEQTRDHWYAYLVKNLFDCPIDEISDNISIISYNYDRSLETYLAPPLMGIYPEIETIEDCAAVIKDIPIIHMYGRLDPLPWEEKKGREYGEKCTSDNLLKMSKKIHLMHEAEEIGTIDYANDLIDKSEKIYILGMDLLNNKNNIEMLDYSLFNNKHLLATGYNFKTAERFRVEDLLKKLTKKYVLGKSHLMSLDAMQEHMILMSCCQIVFFIIH